MNRIITKWLMEFEKPYCSTIEFEKYLSNLGCFRNSVNVLDIGSGIGAQSYYFALKHKHTSFTCIDYNKEFIEIGRNRISELKINNLELECGDWFNLSDSYINKFDGIFNIHSFCCFKRFENPLNCLFNLNPRWIAIKSLFCEEPIDVLIHIRDHTLPEITDENPDGDFNIFSLHNISKYLKEYGYSNIHYQRFQIPINLPKPPKTIGRGTYTIKTDFEERSQFSGPVYLPWYFLVAFKI